MIALTSGEAYTAVGGELTKGTGKKQTVTPTQSKITLNGKEVTLVAYNIGGNNYFKLRDIAKLFDFAVGYDNSTKTITVDTVIGYTE